MLFKTLAFLVFLYFLSRFISRLFLPEKAKKRSTFTFRTYGQGMNPGNPMNSQSRNKNIDRIEEAEFEEIKDKKSKDQDQL